MVEFDVLPERVEDGEYTGRLVLAHDFKDAARRTPLTLEEGLDHLGRRGLRRRRARRRPQDPRLRGARDRRAARARDGGADADLDDGGRLAAGPARGVRRGPHRLVGPQGQAQLPRQPGDQAARAWRPSRSCAAPCPRAIVAAMRAGEIDAVMSHFSLVTPHFVRAVAARRRRALRLDRRRRRADPPLRAHGRRPASSPTTRVCSTRACRYGLDDALRRARGLRDRPRRCPCGPSACACGPCGRPSCRRATRRRRRRAGGRSGRSGGGVIEKFQPDSRRRNSAEPTDLEARVDGRVGRRPGLGRGAEVLHLEAHVHLLGLLARARASRRGCRSCPGASRCRRC